MKPPSKRIIPAPTVNLADGLLKPPEPIDDFHFDGLVCHERLGGLLRHYEQKAA